MATERERLLRKLTSSGQGVDPEDQLKKAGIETLRKMAAKVDEVLAEINIVMIIDIESDVIMMR